LPELHLDFPFGKNGSPLDSNFLCFDGKAWLPPSGRHATLKGNACGKETVFTHGKSGKMLFEENRLVGEVPKEE